MLGTLALLKRSGVHRPGEYGGGSDDLGGGGVRVTSGSITDSRNPWESMVKFVSRRGGVLGSFIGFAGLISGDSERGLLTFA